MTPQPNHSDRNDSPQGGSGHHSAGPRRGGGGGGPRGGGGNRRGGGGPRGAGFRGAPPPRVSTSEEGSDNKDETIELDGVVSAVLAGTMFRVKLRNGHEVLAHISGKMRKRFIRLVIGDQVRLEMSHYDGDKARIVYRM